MFYPAVILLAVTASVLAEDDPCLKFFEHGVVRQCCKAKLPQPSAEFEAIYKECQSLPNGPESCEREMCMATKKGFITPDGKLDISKISEKMQKEVNMDQDILKAITDHCTEDNITKYGPKDVCDALKLRMCIESQMVKACPDWKNDGPCEGLKDLSVMCKNKYD